jgi:hypothetical protein
MIQQLLCHVCLCVCTWSFVHVLGCWLWLWVSLCHCHVSQWCLGVAGPHHGSLYILGPRLRARLEEADARWVRAWCPARRGMVPMLLPPPIAQHDLRNWPKPHRCPSPRPEKQKCGSPRKWCDWPPRGWHSTFAAFASNFWPSLLRAEIPQVQPSGTPDRWGGPWVWTCTGGVWGSDISSFTHSVCIPKVPPSTGFGGHIMSSPPATLRSASNHESHQTLCTLCFFLCLHTCDSLTDKLGTVRVSQ